MSRRNGTTTAGARAPLELVAEVQQNPEAEEAVLGAVLLGGGGVLMSRLLEMGLAADEFYAESRARIYTALIALHDRGDGIDALILTAELRRMGWLDDVGGQAYVDGLAGASPDASNAREHARVVRRLSAMRRRRRAALDALEHPADQDRWAALLEVAAAPVDGSPHDRRRMDPRKLLELADEEPEWRCDRFIADGYVTTLVGAGGIGKSLLTLAIAGAVQTGGLLAGMRCTLGKVVIFDAENGPALMGRRLKATQLPLGDLVYIESSGLDLRRHDHRAFMAAESRGAQLVIFDSIRRLAPGAKENDSDDMAPVMATLSHVARNTGAAVVAIHHRGKDGGDFRGSSAIQDQTDLMFVMDRDPKDPELQWRRLLRCVKCRIAEEPETRWFGIRHWRGQLTFTEAAPFEADAPVRPVRDELAEQILEVVRVNGALTRNAIARELGRKEKDQSTRRAVKEMLEDEDLVEVSGHRVMLAPEGVNGVSDTPDTSDTQQELAGVSPVKGPDPLTPPPATGDG